jgi:ATP-dependent Lon protease
MKKSATIALEYIKANTPALVGTIQTLTKHNIHLHVPMRVQHLKMDLTGIAV